MFQSGPRAKTFLRGHIVLHCIVSSFITLSTLATAAVKAKYDEHKNYIERMKIIDCSLLLQLVSITDEIIVCLLLFFNQLRSLVHYC